MARIIFYPIGNADCCLVRLNSDKIFVFDYADMRDRLNDEDKRIPLKEAFREDIGWPKRKEIDVLAVTHGDNDHVKGISENFWLEHAAKYQGDDRVKFKEMWVPAALIVEEGSEDETRIVREEAKRRFLDKKGIRVFARPEHLKIWLEDRGKKFDDYKHLITDAGQWVPGWNAATDGIAFFTHSPFAERTANNELLDRNDNCIVLQATIRVNGVDTRYLITGDATAEPWQKIVATTKFHKNEERLAWDVLSVPHHCSYKSLAFEKGKEKTKPTPEFEWLLEQGSQRSVMVSTSWEIPAGDTEDKQPPHVQAYRTYRDSAEEKDGEIVVTMENPSKRQPKRTIVEVSASGPTLKKEALVAASIVTSSKAPRMG
jgi:hypothetical protein